MTADPRSKFGLHRDLGWFSAIMLTLSAITPASSVFIIMPGVISQAGTGAILSLLLAGTIGIVVSFVYSELASAFPAAGGEYVIVHETLGRLASFITLIINATVMLSISTVLALGAGDYISKIFNVLPQQAGAIIIAFATIVGMIHIRFNAWITGCVLLTEIACILYLSSVTLVHAHGDIISTFITTPLAPYSNGTTTPISFGTIIVSAAVAIFAFNGYEQAIYLSEEIIGARRKISVIIITSLLVTIILELVPTITTLLSVSISAPTLSSPTIFYDAIEHFGGKLPAKIVACAIILAVFNAAIVNIIMTARFIYSTARDGFWGKVLGTSISSVSASQRTPLVATLAVGAVSASVCAVPLQILLVLTGTGLLVIYALLCISLIVGRVTGSTRCAAFRAPLFPILPAVGFIAMCGVLVANFLDPTTGRPSVVFTAFEVAAAAAIFAAFRRIAPKTLVLPASSDV